jgi:hypothetical protein
MATTYAGVGDPRDFDQVDYGNGVIGIKTDNGWLYPWRPQPYQDVLNDTDVWAQPQIQAFRNANPNTSAEDDGGAWAQMTGEAPLKDGTVLTLGGAVQPGSPQTAGILQPEVDYGGGRYPLSSVSGEGLMRPWTEAFKAPTEEEASQSPGFQFRLNEAMKAISRGAAAKGTFLSGSTGKAMERYAQDYASNEYDKIYNRGLGEYRQAYDIYNNNQTNQFNRLSSMAGTGQQAGTSLGTFGQNYGNAASGLITDIGNANAAGIVGGQNAWNGAFGNIGNNYLTQAAANSLAPKA